MNDGSMPVPDEVPVSRRTRLSLAMATLVPSAPGTTQGTVEGPLTWAATTRRVRFADEAEWDDEYDADTDESERDRSEYVLFDDEDDDGDPIVDDGDTAQQDGESSDDYEARLNGLVPPPMHFFCRPAFSRTGRSLKEVHGTQLPWN